MSKLEKLNDAIAQGLEESRFAANPEVRLDIIRERFLAELREPDDKMMDAGESVWQKNGCYGGEWRRHHIDVLQAMLDAIE